MPTATPLSRVNDFVIRFANVNGSGSASANEMFARAVMRMGRPGMRFASPKPDILVPAAERI